MYRSTQKFFDALGVEDEILKYILTYLYCTKYNEINIYHTDVKKNVSCTGSHKRFLIYYGLCLETAEI